MQAISKDKHEKFARQVDSILLSRSPQDAELIEMKAELDNVFINYRQALDDLRELILEYATRQKNIRQKMRQLLCNEVTGTVNLNS